MKNIKYVLLMVVIIMAITIVNQKEAQALSCAPSTVQEDIDSASVIFAGIVSSVQAATSEKAASASFNVTEYWKGQVGKKISVGGIYTWNGTPNPPVYFKIGETYLVFARSVPNADSAKNIPGNLIASIDCGRTTLLSSATDLKVILGKGFNIDTVVKTETNTGNPISKPVENIKPTPVVETTSTVVPASDYQSNTNEVQVNTKMEVKQNFIQKIFSWFGNLFK